MISPLTLSDLLTLRPAVAELASRSIQVWPDRAYTVYTRAFNLGRGIIQDAGQTFAPHIPVGPVLLLQDDNTRAVAGDTVAQSLRAVGYVVTTMTLPAAPGEHIEATGEAVDTVSAAIQAASGATGVIAVGSGTINDLAKLASYRAGLPYAVVGTAASMNGYTSAIAAILVDGIKRSINCLPPVAVLGDLDVLAAAPSALTLAGLGDLLSKPVSSGDWRLGHLLLDEAFTEVPLALVDTAFKKVQAAARGIGRGDPEAVGSLLEALLLSGISMASAGTSSPASGGEHLISHYWDMTASYRGRHVGLHGAQVGVTTLISATLYQKLRQRRPTLAGIKARVERLGELSEYLGHISVCPAPLQEAIAVEVGNKYPTPEVLRARLTTLSDRWDHIWAQIDKTLQPPEALREVLEQAGAPTTAKELGIAEWELREAFLRARDIRARYTVLDLAWEMGALEDLEDEVLTSSGVLA